MAPPTPQVCVKGLRGPVLAAALRTGRPPDELLRELGLASDLLADVTARVPHAVVNEAWDKLARMTDEPCFGLFAAQVVGAAPLDFVDYALSHSADVRAMVTSFGRWQRMFHDANDAHLAIEGERVAFVHRLARGLPLSRHLAEFILGTWFVKLQRATAPAPPIRVVELSHRPPADRALYGIVFGAETEIVFSASRNALVLDATVLDLPIVAADTNLLALFSQQVERALAPASEPGFLDRARRALFDLMIEGVTDADRLATALETSTRTLHRRLAEHGVPFRELLDDVRARVAKAELAKGSQTVTDVAFLLGYSDLSAFSRAFRRWTGQSPADYRAASRS